MEQLSKLSNSTTNILIVGRPNVGKSTLFNTLIGKKEAITGDEYGLTRDYQIAKCSLFDVNFDLIDTAGFTTEKNNISNKTNQTIMTLLENSDIILFVVDISINITSEDLACWKVVRKTNNDVIIIGNKAELKASKNNVK